MSTADYTSIPSTGKLKLKGVKDSKITKRKKNKPSKDDKPAEDVEDNSVMLRKLADEDQEMESEDKMTEQEGAGSLAKDEDRDGDLGSTVKTEAERRYEEQRKKRVRLHQLPNVSAGLCRTNLSFRPFTTRSWPYWGVEPADELPNL